MKLKDHGKFAATFCSISQKQGVRIVQNASAFLILKDKMEKLGITNDNKEAMTDLYFRYPWQEHFSLSIVDKEFLPEDLPGLPLFKEICETCGESVMDNRHIKAENKVYCKPCAQQKEQRQLP